VKLIYGYLSPNDVNENYLAIKNPFPKFYSGIFDVTILNKSLNSGIISVTILYIILTLKSISKLVALATGATGGFCTVLSFTSFVLLVAGIGMEFSL